jgi:hypothetical protein
MNRARSQPTITSSKRGDPSAARKAERRGGLRPWQIVLAICVLYLGVVALHYRNVLEFVRMGSQYAGEWNTYSRDVEGYDGQFDYYLAIDPIHAASHLDSPAYRTQRILYPLLARWLALGRIDWVPYALLAINIGALLSGTIILERLLVAEHVSRWYALSYGLFAGVLVAVRSSTNEPLAYALVLAAIWLAQRERFVSSVVLLALAAFTKETTLIFSAGYLLYYLSRRQWRRMLIVGLGVGIPFLIWQLVLYGQFGAFGIGSGGAGATPFEVIPFNGIWRTVFGEPRLFFAFGLLPLLIAFIPTVWALWQTITDLRARRQHVYVFLLLANAAVLPFLPFSTYREPLGLLRFLVGLVIGVLLYSAWRKAYRPLRYSVLWLLFGVVVLA